MCVNDASEASLFGVRSCPNYDFYICFLWIDCPEACVYSADQILDLDHRLGIPELARVIAGRGGLPKVVVSSATATAEMYLHGAHVTSWKPNGARDAFYLSPNAIWAEAKAIRGGVPISFPWFADRTGDPKAPAHGFARTRTWQLSAIEKAGEAVVVTMSTGSDEATKQWWPFDFNLVCRATVGAQLKIELLVSNTGDTPFTFEEALHAYYQVGDVETASVEGLDGTVYLDKTDKRKEKKQAGAVQLTAESDRVYVGTTNPLEVLDPSLKRRINIHKQNSRTTVIWNPWAGKSSAMADLGADEWKNFICVETSNVLPSSVELAPGEQHSMAMTVAVNRT